MLETFVQNSFDQEAPRKSDIMEVGLQPTFYIDTKEGHLKDRESRSLQMHSSLWNKIASAYLRTLRVGFSYDMSQVKEEEADTLEKFHEEIEMLAFLKDSIDDAFVFSKGGFLEIVFPDVEKDAKEPFFENGKVPTKYQKNHAFRLEYIDPVSMAEKPIKVTDRSSKNYGKIMGYEQNVTLAETNEPKGISSPILIHPDRIIHIKPLRHGSLGERLYAPVISLENALVSSATIIDRKANPFLDIILEFWDEKEARNIERRTSRLKATHEFIHDKNVVVNVPEIGGRALNIDPYTSLLWKALAAGSGIPETLLFGSGQGTISTSNINMIDWFNTVSEFQGFVTKLINRIDSLYWLMVTGEERTFPIVWNDLYPRDTEREAKTRKLHAETDTILLESGFFTPDAIDKDREEYGLHPVFTDDFKTEEKTEEFKKDVEKVFQTGAEIRSQMARIFDSAKQKMITEAAALIARGAAEE